MEFKKHQMMPGIKKMMQHPEISMEFGDKLDEAKKILASLEALLIKHAGRVKRCSEDPNDSEDKALRGVSEIAYMGFLTTHIKRLNDLIENLGNTEMNMLMHEWVQDYIKEEVKRVGPTIDDVRKKMKDLEKELGMTPDEIIAEVQKGFRKET